MPRSVRAAAALVLAAALRMYAQDTTLVVTPRTYAHDTTLAPRPTIFLGSPDEDRLRVAEILGHAPLAGFLIRSPSARPLLRDSIRTHGFTWVPIRPVFDAAWNSALPFSINDGALWAGKGLNGLLTGGVSANIGRVQVLFSPEVMHSQNEPFAFVPDTLPGRSSYASPFYHGPVSIDLPTRFGAQSFTVFDFGQTAIWVPAGPVDVGVSTENQWWGPAIQNALIMSDNAPGIPEAFVRTNAPVRTGIGDFEGKVIAGELTESLYFGTDGPNDQRTISGLVATFSPAVAPTLSVGVARVVYSPAPDFGTTISRALDAITRWSGTRSSSFDQLFSLFGRWVFPESGLEAYAEWARILPPSSLHQWLAAPWYTQGYTLGMQVAGHVRPDALLRLQAEATNLDQAPPSRAGDTLSFYTSRAVPQGYTQRGQMIGASIGPGGSSQWLALDYMPNWWDVGVFAQRIRWNEDVYFLAPTGFSFFSHDVTVLGGLRGTVRLYGRELHAVYAPSRRLNFMFQNLTGGYGPSTRYDFTNQILRVWVGF
jgi:hypothetical protein